MENTNNNKKSFISSVGTYFVNTDSGHMLILLILTILAGCLIAPSTFPTASTFQSITKQAVEYGLLALGVAICMTSGGIDLSVVYSANLVAIAIGLLLKNNVAKTAKLADVWPFMLLCVLIAIAIGIICGLINGILIGKLNLNAMLVTMGSAQLFNGMSLILTKGSTVNNIPTFYSMFAFKNVGIVPLIFFVLLLAFAIEYYVMNYTSMGRKVLLVGTTLKAANYSGISITRTICFVYILAGIFASFSGLVSLSRMSSAKADYGSSYILITILISVLGGTDPNGGKCSVLGIFLAALSMQVISTLFNYLGAGINTFYRNIVWGSLLLIALIMNYYISKQKHPRRD